jgi:pimeloyl-ACP methyl ester carboxylesterase
VTVSTAVAPDGTNLAVHSLGDGPGVALVGGAFRAAADYLPLATELAGVATVHVIDRRGRTGSGPQGPSYCLDRECEDLAAVARATGARAAFGHSFGGLVVLETAARTTVFDRVAVYDPGVSVAGSIPLGWLPGYRRLLDAGDAPGAFAHFVQGSGGAPAFVARLPRWYLKAVLRVVMRGRSWQRYARLLEAAYHEHVEVGRADSGSLERFRAVRAEVLLLGGGRSPACLSSELLPVLASELGHADVEVLDPLDHFAPDEKAPTDVAARLIPFLARD